MAPLKLRHIASSSPNDISPRNLFLLDQYSYVMSSTSSNPQMNIIDNKITPECSVLDSLLASRPINRFPQFRLNRALSNHLVFSSTTLHILTPKALGNIPRLLLILLVHVFPIHSTTRPFRLPTQPKRKILEPSEFFFDKKVFFWTMHIIQPRFT